jgi:hypothetical protein
MPEVVSRRAGRNLALADDIAALGDAPNKQVDNFANLHAPNPEFENAFDQHFRNFDLENIELKRRAALRLRGRIEAGKESAERAYIGIGNAILLAEQEGHFTPEEFDHLLSGGKDLILLAKSQASMLRRVAKAIRDGIIPEKLIPTEGGYSVAYQCVLLHDTNPTNFRLAIADGSIHPNMSRKDVNSLRVRLLSNSQETLATERADLEAKERTLVRREKTIRKQLNEVVAELREVRALLNAEE